jgi:outer membrane lipopolysaccharide assembly protein LptE/RlpB
MYQIDWLTLLLKRNSVKILIGFFSILSWILVCSGCGYSLKGQGTFLPEHIRKIAIPEFKNNTPRFELEKIITQRVQELFLSRGDFEIVSDEMEADAVLRGIITGYMTNPKSVDEEGRATSYNIRISLDVKFEDLVKKKVLFEDKNYIANEEYQLSSTDENFLDQEEFAIEAAADQLAESLVSAILEGF